MVAVFAIQTPLACKAKPVEQVKHVVVLEVKQDEQFVAHPVVVVGRTHAAVPVYGAIQAVQVITPAATAVTLHAEQPTTNPVPAVVAGAVAPVVQL